MGVISRTANKASFDLAAFMILLASIVFLYMFIARMLLGVVSEDFSTFSLSLSTLLLVLTGELPELPKETHIQIFFWSYLIISFFLMLNGLLAIIVTIAKVDWLCAIKCLSLFACK